MTWNPSRPVTIRVLWLRALPTAVLFVVMVGVVPLDTAEGSVPKGSVPGPAPVSVRIAPAVTVSTPSVTAPAVTCAPCRRAAEIRWELDARQSAALQ